MSLHWTIKYKQKKNFFYYRWSKYVVSVRKIVDFKFILDLSSTVFTSGKNFEIFPVSKGFFPVLTCLFFFGVGGGEVCVEGGLQYR